MKFGNYITFIEFLNFFFFYNIGLQFEINEVNIQYLIAFFHLFQNEKQLTLKQSSNKFTSNKPQHYFAFLKTHFVYEKKMFVCKKLFHFSHTIQLRGLKTANYLQKKANINKNDYFSFVLVQLFFIFVLRTGNRITIRDGLSEVQKFDSE